MGLDRPQSLKESLDEIDLGTQFHLSRYAFLFENLLLSDAVTVSPPIHPHSMNGNYTDDGPGLKAMAESIDNRDDFKTFMQNYAVTFTASGHKSLRREGPPEEGFVKVSRKSYIFAVEYPGATQLMTDADSETRDATTRFEWKHGTKHPFYSFHILQSSFFSIPESTAALVLWCRSRVSDATGQRRYPQSAVEMRGGHRNVWVRYHRHL